MGEDPKKTSNDDATFAAKVGAKAARKLKARRNGAQGVWFGLGMMGLIGWSVAVPTLLGAALGLWLDKHHPGTHAWTVRKAVSSKQPALWFFGSLLVRMSIVLTGFFLIGRGHWQRMLLCLLGFVIGRLIVTWLTRPPVENQSRPLQEASHAP